MKKIKSSGSRIVQFAMDVLPELAEFGGSRFAIVVLKIVELEWVFGNKSR